MEKDPFEEAGKCGEWVGGQERAEGDISQMPYVHNGMKG